MSAVGALLGSLVRNTAVPGTRVGGRFSSIATRASSGVSRRRVFSDRRRVPRRHVYITTIRIVPNASGTQPPSTTLSILELRKMTSMQRNGTISARAASSDQRQTFHTTTIAITPVTTMVPLTAIPYAEVSALDERNSA